MIDELDFIKISSKHKNIKYNITILDAEFYGIKAFNYEIRLKYVYKGNTISSKLEWGYFDKEEVKSKDDVLILLNKKVRFLRKIQEKLYEESWEAKIHPTHSW